MMEQQNVLKVILLQRITTYNNIALQLGNSNYLATIHNQLNHDVSEPNAKTLLRRNSLDGPVHPDIN